MKLFSIRTFYLVAGVCWLLSAWGGKARAQYAADGSEYAIVGGLPGDQVFPDAAISTSGGYVVWQDNTTDGNGSGVSAMRLDGTLSGTLSPFRVNVQGDGNQENPRVALLKNGGAVFVWQGGEPGKQHIYARFTNPHGTFLTTNDVLVNTFTNNFQVDPALTVLTNGNVVIVWGSYNQAGSASMQDVYGRIFSPDGSPLGSEFLINQFINYNQRTPAVAALSNGGFTTIWVSEQERSVASSSVTNSDGSISSPLPSIDIYARLYDANGAPQVNEFLVNTDSNPCANPSVAAADDGAFLVAWDERDMASVSTNSLDIYARAYSGAGVGGAIKRVNTFQYGDQYAPKVSALNSDYLVVWTSLGQDGSREGVYGQMIRENGALAGDEFRVNGTTMAQQMQPTVVSNGKNELLAIWTSFVGIPDSFDLYAQRYLSSEMMLQAMSAPYVWAPFVTSNNVYQPQLVVSWPTLDGLSVSNFEVYVDDSATPIVVTTNRWVMTAADGLVAGGTHSFRVGYVTSDGERSPLSPAASGTAWNGGNYYGIPFEWMQQYYGNDFANWPSDVNAPITNGSPTLLNIFLSGGSPLDSSTWLVQTLQQTHQGLFLTWNTQPGATYQVLVKTNLMSSWSNLGAPRFATGTADSIYVGNSSAGYYRIVLLR